MHVGDYLATFSVGTRFLVFALEITSPLARLLHFSTYCFMSRSAIADFPEGATQFCTRIVNVSARCIVQGPVICELLGDSSSSYRRSWSFWSLSNSFQPRKPPRTACHPLQFQASPSAVSPRRSHIPLEETLLFAQRRLCCLNICYVRRYGSAFLGCRRIFTIVPASPRFLSRPSAASPSMSLAESCDLPPSQ